MTKQPSSDKREFESVAIGAIMNRITRPAYRTHGPAIGQLLGNWPDIVGPALAAVSVPRRLLANTLTVGCSGPVALELQHSSTVLAERINSYCGSRVIEHLRFVQQPPPLGRAFQPTCLPEPKPQPVEDIPDGSLRDALTRLSSALRSRTSGLTCGPKAGA